MTSTTSCLRCCAATISSSKANLALAASRWSSSMESHHAARWAGRAAGEPVRRHGARDERTVKALALGWRHLPESFGPSTRVWSQFRRWSRNGTWAGVDGVARGRAPTGQKGGGNALDGRHRHSSGPRCLEWRVHVPRPRWPYGRAKGAKGVVAVDVTGLPVAAVFVPASTHGTEVAHGHLGRSRRLTKSFENTTSSATGWLQVACIATPLRHISREWARQRPTVLAA